MFMKLSTIALVDQIRDTIIVDNALDSPPSVACVIPHVWRDNCIFICNAVCNRNRLVKRWVLRALHDCIQITPTLSPPPLKESSLYFNVATEEQCQRWFAALSSALSRYEMSEEGSSYLAMLYWKALKVDCIEFRQRPHAIDHMQQKDTCILYL